MLIGFGTDGGNVTAASNWDGAIETKRVRTSLPGSWGALMREVGPDRFFLPIRGAPDPAMDLLLEGRIERLIGVIYCPETERRSHYGEAVMGRQFDGRVWSRRAGRSSRCPRPRSS